jgi:hypothetical protein
VATLALLPESTRAQSKPQPTGTAELSWVRDASARDCPDPRAMRAEVADRLGRDPFGPGPGPTIEATAEHSDIAWSAHIAAYGTDGRLIGERELTSAAGDCTSLAAATALAVALVIDPDAVARATAAREAFAGKPTPPAQPAETAVRRSPPADDDGLVSWVDLRAIASAGLLPGFAPGVALSADLALSSWFSLSAALSHWPEQKKSSGSGAIAFGLSAASLAACAEPVALDAVGVAACAGAWLGSLHSVIYELIPTAPGDRLWSALSAGARIYAPRASAVRASLALDALAPLTRQRFTVGGQRGTAFRQGAVAFHAQLGVGVHF